MKLCRSEGDDGLTAFCCGKLTLNPQRSSSSSWRSLVALPLEPKTLALVACSPERDGHFFVGVQFRLTFRNAQFVQSPADAVTARVASYPLGSASNVKVRAASLFCALIYMDMCDKVNGSLL